MLKAGSVKESVKGSAKGSVKGNVKESVQGSVKGSVKGSIKWSVKERIKGSVKGNCIVKGALTRFLKVFSLKHQTSLLLVLSWASAKSPVFLRSKKEFFRIFLIKLVNFLNE